MEEPVILPSKSKLHPLLEALPDHLKDPANYEKIRKAIYETLVSSCSHSDMQQMAKCPKCSKKMMERRLLLQKLGFKNPMQYKAWQAVHEEAKRLYPEAYEKK